MKKERIIISFDEDDKNKRIEIDLEPSPVADVIPTRSEVKSLSFNSDNGLTNFFKSGMTFPSGIDIGFRIRFKTDLKDGFVNSVLYNKDIIVLSSVSGNVYFLDIENGKLKSKLEFTSEPFEKTGVVYDNNFYIGSVYSIYEAVPSAGKIDRDSVRQIYEAPRDFYIWSNLNLNGSVLSFTEVNPDEKVFNLVLLDLETNEVICKQNSSFKIYIKDHICSFSQDLYFISDDILFSFSKDDLNLESFSGVKVSIMSQLMSDKRRLFVVDKEGTVKSSGNGKDFFNTGINVRHVNSSALVKDTLLFGHSNGWVCYNMSGLKLYDHEDSDENYIRAVSDNMISVSRKNKLIMHNAEKFVEAEGIAIKRDGEEAVSDIVSGVFTEREVLSLTKDGILVSITNDRLNINV